MTMNRILLVLIVASGFLLIFYANNDIFTRKRWISLFQQADDDGEQIASSVAAAAAANDDDSTADALLSPSQSRSGQSHRRRGAQPLTYDDLHAVRYEPASNRSTEHNIFVIYTKENYMLKTKFELFMKSLLKYSSVPLHLHIISDARSEPSAESIVRKQMLFYKHQTARVQYSLYNVTECAGRIGDITRAMMPHFSVPGSQYSDALFYVSLGLHRIVDPGMQRAILIDCDVVFRSDVSRLFEEFNKFSPENLFGLSPELTPVYYHVLYKFRARNPNTNFGKPYYPALDGGRNGHAAGGGGGHQKHTKHGYPGLNSGVVMMNFDRIRRSQLFEDSLRSEHVERLVRKYHFKGHLGDQDYYSLLGYDYPGMIYRLDCVWNRQLCTWWKDHGYSEIFDTFFHCEGKIRLYHGNCNTRVPE